MSWLFDLHRTHPVAHAIGMLALVCVLGMALGSLRFRGIGLGNAGVLFAGIILGHFSQAVDRRSLDFVREFGLALFVFTLGLQLGPGFFAVLRRRGLKLNVFATVIVLLGAICAPLAGYFAGFDPAAVLGIFAGASINIPALGAGTQTLSTMTNIRPDQLAMPALACAVTYPVAIAGSIAVVLLLQRIFRVDLAHEAREFIARDQQSVESLERRTLLVTNPNLEGIRLDAIPGRIESGITISRVCDGTQTVAATGSAIIHTNNRLAVVGTASGLEQFQRIVGERSDEDLVLTESNITYRRVAVTDHGVLGKTVDELHLDDRFGVAVTRVTRADIEMSAVPGLRLQFGDKVNIVGCKEDLDRAADALGNSLKDLNSTHFIPFFVGILLGVLLGTLPIHIPGLSQPVRLSLAGGPLLVALVLGRIGRIGHQVWHMPTNTNLAFREFGIALFFAAVGLLAGGKFFAIAFSIQGLKWLLAGMGVTVLPLLIVGLVARGLGRMNFMDLAGLLAGSMTNPPGLSFATNVAGSDAPNVAYATVYPLTTLLRILCAQVLAIVLFR